MYRLGGYGRMLAGTVLLVTGLLCLPEPSFAHSTTTPAASAESAVAAVPKDLTPDELNALIAKMSDVEVRQLVLERLAATAPAAPPVDAAPNPEAKNVLDVAIDTIHLAASRTVQVILHSGATTALILSILVNHASAAGISGVLTFVALLAVVIALGALAEIALERLLRNWRTRKLPDAGLTVRQKIARNATLFLRDTVGQLAFFVVVSIAIIELMPEQDLAVARILVVWLVIFPRFAGAVLRFILAPKQTQVLAINSEDWTRRFLYRHLYGMVILTGVNTVLIRLIQLTGDAVPGLGFWLNLIIFVWLGVIIVYARKGITILVRGNAKLVTPREEWVARVYPWYALTLVVLTWLFSMIGATVGLQAFLLAGSHLATLGLLLLIPLVDAAVRSMVVQLMRPMQGQGLVAVAANDAARRAYVRMARVLVVAGSFALIGRLWGFGLVDIASSGVGDRFAERVIIFIDIILIGYFVWEIARLLINRRLAEEFTASLDLPADEDATGIQITKGSSRLATVLPIFSWIVQSAIISVTALMALSNLGVDVTALVAGAGIFGLAIGFGSQKLVSDIVSGMFFLVDDAFRIGEYVKLGDVEGTIEKFALRSMMLRDSKGPLYCVPYSAIPKVTNFARDWGIMKLKFNLTFGTDVEKVRKIFKKIGQQMMDNPDLKDGFIEPFKSQGVRDIKDGYIVIGGKFMHKPGAQFTIRKEIFRLVQLEFDNAGIKFYRSEVRVLPSDIGAPAPVGEAGAAAQVVVNKAAEASGA